jgi:hypothetical protein
MKSFRYSYVLWLGLFPLVCEAANFEATLESLVNSIVSRILPILSLGYVGKNIFSHVQGDPNAKRETAQVAVAVVALLGIQGVWAWLRSQVR